MNARPGISVSTNLPSRVIRGLAYCNGKLFVVTERNDSVLVYDVQNRNKQLPSLKVAGLSEPRDIAACPETCCVYIAEWSAYCSRVWRVSTLDGRVDGWLPNMTSTAPLATPLSLSVRSRRVLVTTGNELRLTGSDGEELKRVKVKVSLLRHAVETATGTFIVCCGDVSGPNVAEVDDDGLVIRAYSGPLPLKNACCLSMDSDGRVLVSGGETMLLLSPQLGILQVLRNSRFYDLHKMCFVENVGLLAETGYSSVGLTMMAVRRL